MNKYRYRESLLSMKLTAEELKVGTDEENYFGLLLTKEGIAVIAMEGGSSYLSKKKAIEIYERDPEHFVLLEY